ncbi:MAG: transcriptional regulator [Bacteroidetes bacterium]|nr:transcriptional regulator [Bacteroidota bacterium]
MNGYQKAFENRIRLGIMSALSVNDRLSFNELKELLTLTDGNLASHLKSLEKEGFVVVSKSFIGRIPHTTYSMTDSGRIAFMDHLKALEALIGLVNRSAGPSTGSGSD